MHSLLLVDDQELFRTPLAEALREHGYEVREAGTAPQALELAMRRKPDLMMLDLAMPNIDGFELLRYFRGRVVFRSVPVIFITAHARRDFLVKAASMGVKDYMLKSSFSVHDLVERIRSHLGDPFEDLRSRQFHHSPSSVFDPITTSPGPPSFTIADKPGLKTVERHAFMETISARCFPSSVSEIIARAGDPHSSLSEIEAVLRRDPMLAAQVLAKANSPHFHHGSPVGTLEEALRILGMTQVVRIVSAGAVLKPEELGSAWGMDLRRLWSHSLAAGMVAQRLREAERESFGFLMGLLHELPALLALAYLREDWLAWKAQGERNGWSLGETLGHAFQADFVEIAKDVLLGMQLPVNLADPIREHHDFFQAESPKEPGSEARLIEIAHQFAVVLGRSGGTLSLVSPIRSEQMRLCRSPDTLGLDLLPLDGQILQWETMSGLVEDSPSVFPNDPLQVLYWHPEGWFLPDPLEVLLQKVSHAHRVEVLSELESHADLKVVLAEQNSPDWEAAAKLKGLVLVLHRGSIRGPVPKTLRTMRLPLTEAKLAQILQDL